MSVLTGAALSDDNAQSSLPLLVRLQAAESRLVTSARLPEWSTQRAECEAVLQPQLQAVLALLEQHSRSVSSPSALSSAASSPALASRFPDMDRLLASFFTRPMSAPVMVLLVGCCTAWIKATSGGAQRPRWLTSPTSAPSSSDAALIARLSAWLCAESESWPLRLSTVAFLSALATEHAGRETHVHAWLSSPAVLPHVVALSCTRSTRWAARVRALCQSSAVRVLAAVFHDGEHSKCDTSDAFSAVDDEPGDILCFRLLNHAWTLLCSVVLAHRHTGDACTLCTEAAFASLMQSVRQLWQSHREALSILPAPSPPSVVTSSSTAGGGAQPAIVSLLCTSWSAVMAFFFQKEAFALSNEAAVSFPTDHPSALEGASAAPPVDSLLALWCHSAAEVVRAASEWWSDDSVPVPVRQSAFSLLSPILTVIKRGLPKWLLPPARTAFSAQSHADHSGHAAVFETIASVLVAVCGVAERAEESAASAICADMAEDALKGALQVCTVFVTQLRGRRELLGRCVELSCTAFLPLAAAVLSNTSATLDVLHLLFASLHLVLLACLSSAEQTVGLLSALVQRGIVDGSWQCMDALMGDVQRAPLRLHGDRRAQAALDVCRRWNAAVLTALTWSTTAPRVDEKLWHDGLHVPFCGEQRSWQRTLQTLASSGACAAPLQLLLPLCIASLLCRAVQTRSRDREDGTPQRSRATALAVHFSEKDVLRAMQQLLLSQPRSAVPSSSLAAVLDRATLVQVALIALLLEDEFRLSLSAKGSKAKEALFALMVTAGVTLADLILAPSLPCHLTPKSLAHWVWRQSPAQHNVAELHDALFASLFSPPPASPHEDTATATWRDGGSPEASSVSDPSSSTVIHWLADEMNALKALVRRWHHALPVRSVESPCERSAAVDELLPFTHRLLLALPAPRALRAGLLEPITALLSADYYTLLAAESSSGIACIGSLLSILLCLVSAAASAMFSIDPTQLASIFGCATHHLLSHGQRGGRDATDAHDLVRVQLLSVQLLNAVLQYASNTGASVQRWTDLLREPSVVPAISSLMRSGRSLVPHPAVELSGVSMRSSEGGRRVSLAAAGSNSGRSSAEDVVRLRLQLQLAVMTLSNAMREAEVVPCDDVLPLLHHPCLEVRTAALRYLTNAVRDADVDSALLLGIQSSLLPYHPPLLRTSALHALSGVMASSSPDARAALVAQPWHSFVLHASLLALSQADDALPCTGAAVGIVLRYLALLANESGHCGDASAEPCAVGDAADDGASCIARRHFAVADSRLLLPLLSCAPLGSRGLRSPRSSCISSAYHFVVVLGHLHHAQCLPLAVVAALPSELRAVLALCKETRGAFQFGQPLLCPASVKERWTCAAAVEDKSPLLSQSSPPWSQSQPVCLSPWDLPLDQPPSSPVAGEQQVRSTGGLCMCEIGVPGVVRDVRGLLCCVETKCEQLLGVLAL